MKKTRIMDAPGFNRTIMRLSHEIAEKFKGVENVVIVGIRTRGEFLAKRIAETIKKIEGKSVNVGILDITLYRDDLRGKLEQPKLRSTEILFDINKKNLVLVDDVLFTGRTIRAALDALIDIGRPEVIQLLVFIDRGHRQLPIRADFVGKSVPTSGSQQIEVKMQELDEEDAVFMIDGEES